MTETGRLPRGLERCSECGKVVRPAARKVPHEKSPECFLRRVAQLYKDRGWVRAHGGHGPVIARAELPMERAPISYYEVHSESEVRIEYHMGSWAPTLAVRAAEALVHQRLSKENRALLVRRMHDDETLFAAVDAVVRCGGHVPAAWGKA